jgi:hypothetical protein
VQGLTRVAPLRSATLARRWRHRAAAVVSFAIPAMARPLCPAQPGHGPIERQCPIRMVSVHLLGTAGQLLRVLFLDHQAARLLRSQWAHLRPAALRAPRQGPDPGCESAAGARSPGPGPGALRRLPGGIPAGLSTSRGRCVPRVKALSQAPRTPTEPLQPPVLTPFPFSTVRLSPLRQRG